MNLLLLYIIQLINVYLTYNIIYVLDNLHWQGT